MNLFIREMKANFKSFIIFLLISVIFVIAGMGEGQGLIGDYNSATMLVEMFPKSLQVVMGMYDLDLSTLDGYYACMFYYVVIIALIYAGSLGGGIFAKEEIARTDEFLYTKPALRSTVFLGKFSAVACYLFIFTWVMIITHQWTVLYLMKMDGILKLILLSFGGLFLVQVMVATFAAMWACLLRKPKKAGGLATGLVVFSYILGVWLDLADSPDYLWYLVITNYVDMKNLLANGTLYLPYLYLSAGLLSVFLLIGLLALRRRSFPQ